MNCNYSSINSFLTINDKCYFVSNNCPYEYINFYSFHYCILKGSIPLTSISIIIILFILFFILSSTSDIFLSSAITKIIEILNINQNIATVTLLAFGNGAPDVIASLVASAEPEGISFSISSLIGTGLFITSFVLGLVVFKAKEISLDKKMFNRNLILYLISLFHIIIIGIKKNISIIDSMGFIFIYMLNIIFSCIDSRKSKENVNNQDNQLINKEKDINDNSISNHIKIELEQKSNSIKDFYREYINLPKEDSTMNEVIIQEIKEDIKKEQEYFINNEKAYSEVINENMMLAKIYFKKQYLYYKETEWGEISPYWKFFYIVIDLPLTFIRELTIPVSEKKKWNKAKFCFMPLCDFIFISYVFKCKQK